MGERIESFGFEKPAVPAEEPRKPSKIKWLIVLFSVFIVGGSLALFFLLGRESNPHIAGVEFKKPDSVLIGEPFVVSVSVTNPSNQILQDARLILNLPVGVSLVGQQETLRTVERMIGDITPGSLTPNTFNLIALGDNLSLARLSATLEYRVSGSKVEYSEKSEVDVALSQPAISLDMEGPSSVLSSESFDILLRYKNNSAQPFDGLRLKVTYPAAFKAGKTEPAPQMPNIWSLENLARGASAEIKISGAVTGSEGQYFPIKAEILGKVQGKEYALVTKTLTVGVQSSPLALAVFVNGKSDYIARRGEQLSYEIKYKNNSDTAFENITVTAKLIGEMFNFSSIMENLPFNSLTNTLTWTSANMPELALLSPGEEGMIRFMFRTKDSFPISRIGDKNYLLKVSAQIESPTVPSGTPVSRTISVAKSENKVYGELGIDARAFFWDAASGIANTGPFPPKVGQPTQYTIHWVVKSMAADFSGVTVTGFLQPGIRWTGKVKSSVAAVPSYDPNSGKVTWLIDHLQANRGIVGDPVEAIFQVSATPSTNQVGRDITLLEETKLEGRDDFTGFAFSATDQGVTTRLPDDPNAPVGTGVQP